MFNLFMIAATVAGGYGAGYLARVEQQADYIAIGLLVFTTISIWALVDRS